MEPLAVVRERLHRQRLAGPPFATPVDAVRWLGAVQAQEHAEVLWSVAMRVRGGDAALIEAALDRGEIIRTHALRPTWHLVAAADLRWLMRLTAPRVQARNARRYEELELDGATLARAHDAIARALERGEPLTRPELGAALEAAGISTDGQRLAHIVMHAELELLVCSGPRRGRQHTYALADRVLAPDGGAAGHGRPGAPFEDGGSLTGVPVGREATLAELARRYFASHGPATVRDFCWWASLTAAEAREAIALAGIDPAEAGGEERAPTGVLLVPTFDEMLVAYRDVRGVIAPGAPVETLLGRLILLDGLAVGTWRRTLRAREVVVSAALGEAPDLALLAGLEAAAARFGAFLGLPARLDLVR